MKTLNELNKEFCKLSSINHLPEGVDSNIVSPGSVSLNAWRGP